jgi:hypothetical protein
MLAALAVALRSLALICGGHRAVALENLALRQQLAVFKRTVRRPQLRHRDRLFWMLLANTRRDWRTALIVVDPDTVVRWPSPMVPSPMGAALSSEAGLAARVRMRPFVPS